MHEEFQGNIQEEWRHIRFLSGHWSPWTVTILALHGQRLPTAALKELHHCSNLLLLHLEGCGLTSAEFFGDLWSLQRLLLPHNELQTLRGLKNLPHLEELCVKANPIATFRDLEQLAELPALRRLDLQAVDGSEAAPVCAQPCYRQALLALLSRSSSETRDGSGGCNSRLDVLDGQRLHLPDLHTAVTEALAAAGQTKEANTAFRADAQRVLNTASRTVAEAMIVSLSPRLRTGSEEGGDGSIGRGLRNPDRLPLDASATQEDEEQSPFRFVMPSEACMSFSQLLSTEVQQALSDVEALVQKARRATAEAKRFAALSLGGLAIEA
ncbi:leucine rich repeat-containing protein [Cyclospora cayetanensis]|uniref:Leucine rich repeat-containing protein n=1 Tax=Cyclospora cayetanensis TaxID=88456 RepID=A0A1D3CSL9_9EIME|nr:leucine rich repeat-containing protein [Cyclospora cayetanensis]